MSGTQMSSNVAVAIGDLDEVVGATEAAAVAIMDVCERLLHGTEPVQDSVNRIYEACTFQDIVSQRIGRVVRMLKETG